MYQSTPTPPHVPSPGSLPYTFLRHLFLFRKQAMPFLTVDAIISNQAFSHDRRNIFPGLSYKKAKNTFSNRVRKNDVGAQVELS